MNDNRRVVKNTMMLYIRMLLSMVVSFYTSRVVLDTLGVEDYGIYGVVGGVVGMFSFLNATMSAATSRFMSYEMGKGNHQKLRETFSSALLIHIGIALVVFVLAETIGLWFMNNKLVIPDDRIYAAHLVYQLSIVSMVISVTQVPYSACIISHEKMDVYAYVEILKVTLKLLIVYLLLIGDFDKLILYAVLVLCVTIVIASIYRIYCVRRYQESHFSFVWNPSILKGLLSFSTYNLYGNMGSVVNMQGTNFVLNIFFGVVLNSASSIAFTVSGVVSAFTSNIMVAFRPRIMINYAQDNIVEYQNLLIWALKIILFVYMVVAIPLFVEIDTVLAIWLKEVPKYTNVFCRCIIICIFFETLRYIIIMGIHAVGKVGTVSLFTGTVLLLNPLFVYITLKFSLNPNYTYFSIIFANMFLSVVNFGILMKLVPEISIKRFFIIVVLLIVISLTVIAFVTYISYGMQSTFLRIAIITCISTVTLVAMFYLLCLNSSQRVTVNSYILSKIKKHG